jgi:hypothetical protein
MDNHFPLRFYINICPAVAAILDLQLTQKNENITGGHAVIQ